MKKAPLDWAHLPFSFIPSKANIRFHYQNGSWGEGKLSQDFNINIPLASTALQYGQSIFEGLKAFEGPDGKVRIFRPLENAKRFADSARTLLMPPFPEEKFVEACEMIVKENLEFVPPFGSGASLYIRPFMIGTTPRVGVRPADEYEMVILVTPVGPYFPQGFSTSHLIVTEEFDRAAPHGVGQAKCAGNYAAGLRGSKFAKDKGFLEVLYLDAVHKRYLEEAGPANFFAITHDGKLLSPSSSSILKGITSQSIRELALHNGIKVEERPVSVDEFPNFAEAALCGTAAVIMPIGSVSYHDKEYKFFAEGKKPGPICTMLYQQLTQLQRGEADDPFRWTKVVL